MVISIALVTATSTSVLYALYLLIQPKRIHLLAIAITLGTIGFVIALGNQNLLLTKGILTLKQINLFSAPLLEEVLKAALLAAFIIQVKTMHPGEGAFYGFAVGVGFSILESAAYIMNEPSQALNMAVARSVSVNLMHSIGISLVGYGIVMWRQHRLGVTPPLLLVAAAIVIHTISNVLTTEMGVYGAATAIGLSIAGVMFLVLLSKTAFHPATNAAPAQS